MLSRLFAKNQNETIIKKIVFFETSSGFSNLDIYKCLFFISQFTFQLFLKSRLIYTFKPKIMIRILIYFIQNINPGLGSPKL
jgi:hypothetical protein